MIGGVILLFMLLVVVLVVTGPFILFGSVFVRGYYGNNVRRGFKTVSENWLDWGVYVSSLQKKSAMKTESLYSDSLVVLTQDEIIFEHYYFPIRRRKVVRLADIERITVEPPTLWNGKWRLHGTGNFKTWFPQDYKRPKRDRIFFATLKTQWVRIGFTVENGDQVEKILRDKNLIKSE